MMLFFVGCSSLGLLHVIPVAILHGDLLCTGWGDELFHNECIDYSIIAARYEGSGFNLRAPSNHFIARWFSSPSWTDCVTARCASIGRLNDVGPRGPDFSGQVGENGFFCDLLVFAGSPHLGMSNRTFSVTELRT